MTNTSQLMVDEYTSVSLRREASSLMAGLNQCTTIHAARERLRKNAVGIHAYRCLPELGQPASQQMRSRDCLRAINCMLDERSEKRIHFSMVKALHDIALDFPRPDLEEAFYAEIIHLARGLECRSSFHFLTNTAAYGHLSGREAAQARSDELDRLWEQVTKRWQRYGNGLEKASWACRMTRKWQVMSAMNATAEQWDDWRWHATHVLRDARALAQVAPLSEAEKQAVNAATRTGAAFGVTPYYASLMDEHTGDDLAIRMQVLPSAEYVQFMSAHRGDRAHACDYMKESDTSPVDLITRRYPGVVILKPCATCPQICMYCQRNWEMRPPMDASAMATPEQLDVAIDWIRRHPAIHEVLITGGDPLAMDDSILRSILERLAAVDHVDLIRIGTRMPVTVPMRITQELAEMLGSFRQLGQRDVAIVTHVEHPAEVTLELAEAVDRLRRSGLSVYNQQVFTFYVSRRFETALLRMLLRRIGIDPYYTFMAQCKPETASYRVPLARILQERKEEARLLPGLRRTDEPVFNVPGLGKNYLRAAQHRDLLSILADGSRVYEFHAWEKNVLERGSHTIQDMPILEYLRRLAEWGEEIGDYDSIWYYF